MGGWVAPGFEAVQRVFADNVDLFGKGGGAFTAYQDGKPVVDLWGGSKKPGVAWEEDTTTVLFSATKGLANMCLQILVDRGQLDLEAPIADYWPEFAANGKERALVKHIPLHSLGVIGLPNSRDILRWKSGGWDKYDEIAAALASAKPVWEPGTKGGYHAITFGWLAAELVRRVSGVSIGQFFQKEIAGPLALDTYIGTPADKLANVAQIWNLSSDGMPKALSSFHEKTVEATRDPSTMYGQAFIADGEVSGIAIIGETFNSPDLLQAELPFGGGTSSARSMAKLFALLANGGELDGVRIFSAQSIKDFSTTQVFFRDEVMASLPLPWMLKGAMTKPVPRTHGFMANQVGNPMMGDFFGPNPHACGVQGLGGQVAFFDPDHKISAGFVRSDPALMDSYWRKLNTALYESLGLQPKPKAASKLGERFMTRVQRKANAASAGALS